MNDDSLTGSLYPIVGWWHGTGRYKHEGQKVVDILQGIIASGGLIPFEDNWDQKRDKTSSVSIARARSYARLYASLYFPKNEMTIGEYVRRLVSGTRFFLTSILLAWIEYPPPHPSFVGFKEKAEKWTAKFGRGTSNLARMLLFGNTDIASNYPILIGIKPGPHEYTKGSRFVDLHENRSKEPILVGDFTHVEVPAKHVVETRQLLEAAGYKVPVIALEAGDRCA